MKRLGIGLLALASVLWPCGLAARDADQEALFAEGNRLYQEGDFVGAVISYGAVVEAGFESATLYYNLGNAHFPARRDRAGRRELRAGRSPRPRQRRHPGQPRARQPAPPGPDRAVAALLAPVRLRLVDGSDSPGRARNAGCRLLPGPGRGRGPDRAPAAERMAHTAQAMRLHHHGGDGPSGSHADGARDGAGQARASGRDGRRSPGTERTLRKRAG